MPNIFTIYFFLSWVYGIKTGIHEYTNTNYGETYEGKPYPELKLSGHHMDGLINVLLNMEDL